MSSPSQYALRSLKAFNLATGPPSYALIDEFIKPTAPIRVYAYSADGRYFACASVQGVKLYDATSAQLISEIPIKTVIDISFSPKGTLLSTWERLVTVEDGQPGHKNLRVWETASGTEIASFAQKAQDGWAIQFTEDESKAIRIVPNEVQVYNPADFSAGVVEKLRLEGVTSVCVSPGRNPGLALFVAEKKGAPASVKIHSLATLATTSSSKTFYKADKIQMKWNKSGTNLLFLAQTEVDKTGKSYYGESNLYIMSAAGNFDSRITLDKEGGIHDFAWSPNDREFSVCYGYMPAKTVIFDIRVNVIHDFGTQPRNFIAYNPQGRLLCLAGFGNLAGQVDIWDRKTLKKVATFEAPNTSHCEWSPDGRLLLCATLSPRLRVDNGVRIFYYTGTLLHVEAIEELYQASWRPSDAALYPFGGPLDDAPAVSTSVSSAPIPVKVAAAAGGAYRPPHARGTLTPTFFKREDEGGLAYVPSNGANLFPASGNGRTSPTFQSRGRRTIPGAAAPTTTDSPVDSDADGKSRRKKKDNKGRNDSAPHSGASTPSPFVEVVVPAPVPILSAAAIQAAEALTEADKKRRALMKKLMAIDQLKVKKKMGEKLELTQEKKLDSEAEIRKQLADLA